jgi:hypothetical protein
MGEKVWELCKRKPLLCCAATAVQCLWCSIHVQRQRPIDCHDNTPTATIAQWAHCTTSLYSTSSEIDSCQNYCYERRSRSLPSTTYSTHSPVIVCGKANAVRCTYVSMPCILHGGLHLRCQSSVACCSVWAKSHGSAPSPVLCRILASGAFGGCPRIVALHLPLL